MASDYITCPHMNKDTRTVLVITNLVQCSSVRPLIKTLLRHLSQMVAALSALSVSAYMQLQKSEDSAVKIPQWPKIKKVHQIRGTTMSIPFF